MKMNILHRYAINILASTMAAYTDRVPIIDKLSAVVPVDPDAPVAAQFLASFSEKLVVRDMGGLVSHFV